MKICSVEGCGRAFLARGMCSFHYYRWRRLRPRLKRWTKRGVPKAEAFLQASLLMNTDECVLWPYSHGGHGHGYALMMKDGRFQLVHRIVCTEVHGEPPTPKHVAAHSCGNGQYGCINWRHLRWATREENRADMLRHATSGRQRLYLARH